MIKVDRNAPGQVMLRDFFTLAFMIGVAWLSIIGAQFMIWLTVSALS
jgi:hypothetical protein|tara:strand:+ start:259 stop:399 length:141 start_codon:yes stop_codon:yes gene_type:complete